MRQTNFFFEIDNGRPQPEPHMTRKSAANVLRRWRTCGRSGWAKLHRVLTDGMRGYVLSFNNGPTCGLFVVSAPAPVLPGLPRSTEPVEVDNDPHRTEAYFNLVA